MLGPTARLVFVDSSAFFASLVRNDRQHLEARAIMERCRRERLGLLTSNFIRAETHALLLNKVGYSAGRDFLRQDRNFTQFGLTLLQP